MIKEDFAPKRGAYASLDNHYSGVKPFYQTDLKKTLEGIMFSTESQKEKGILERLFFDKSKTQKATVKALLQEVELREKLNSHLLNKIDDGICRQHTFSMQLDNQQDHYQFDRFMEIKKQKMQFEQNVLELEKEKRKEHLECWKDLMFLKNYLLSALKDYWELVKKREIFKDDSVILPVKD
jgi:hypothetical protein